MAMDMSPKDSKKKSKFSKLKMPDMGDESMNTDSLDEDSYEEPEDLQDSVNEGQEEEPGENSFKPHDGDEAMAPVDLADVSDEDLQAELDKRGLSGGKSAGKMRRKPAEEMA